MKNTKTKNQNTTLATFEDLREKFLDTYELPEKFLDELDSIPENDLDSLKAFINRYEKLEKIQIPEKLQAVKLADLSFDIVELGGLVKFHYTKKAVNAMLKNNIVCDLAFSDNSITADNMPEYDTAIITAIDSENITAISKENGVEYCLVKDDFSGTINGVQHASYKNCLFGILPFTYKKPASVTA